ncbi:TPA: hypothetical protein H1012_03455 [archaeon]|nr:hypothetical protein [Candidatus Naiadarchaeales archaeon SRR2090159.bin1288]
MVFKNRETVDAFIETLTSDIKKIIERLKKAEAHSEGEAKERFQAFRHKLELAAEWQELARNKVPCQMCESPLSKEEKVCPICNTEQK